MKNTRYYNFMYLLCITGFFVCFGMNLLDIGIYYKLKPLVYIIGLFYAYGAHYYKKSYTNLIIQRARKRSRTHFTSSTTT